MHIFHLSVPRNRVFYGAIMYNISHAKRLEQINLASNNPLASRAPEVHRRTRVIDLAGSTPQAKFFR